MKVLDVQPTESNNTECESVENLPIVEYEQPLEEKRKVLKIDERTKCDLCGTEMSIKTLRYSHAKNCKAQKQQQQQQQLIQPKEDYEHYEEPPRQSRSEQRQNKYATLFSRAFN
jgi:predicted RNA-binding protein with RPS1 domain